MANSLYDFLVSELTSSTSGGVNTAEGQNPSTVNDALRNQKQLIAAFLDDLAGMNTVGGSATAITVTAAQGFTAYGTGAGQIANGTWLMIKMADAATGAATIAVNGLTAKKVRRQGDAAIQAGDWSAGGYLILRYDTAYDGAAGAWVLLNRDSADGDVTTTGTQTLTNKTLTSPVLTTPQINDTTADHQYIVAVSELAADRTVTLPLLGANDTFVFAAFAQTLTNKTISGSSNAITDVSLSTGVTGTLPDSNLSAAMQSLVTPADGAVLSYGLFTKVSGAEMVHGESAAGSTLRWSATWPPDFSGTPSGTWMCKGRVTNVAGAGNDDATTVFQRTA